MSRRRSLPKAFFGCFDKCKQRREKEFQKFQYHNLKEKKLLSAWIELLHTLFGCESISQHKTNQKCLEN